jgi:hypothetical protein
VVAPLAGPVGAPADRARPVVTGLLLAAAGLALVALRLRDDLGDAELAGLLGRVRRRARPVDRSGRRGLPRRR